MKILSTVAYLQWSATSVGAVNQGAPHELEFSGNVRVTYDPASNKLSSATLSFDTGAVARQIKTLTFSLNADFPSDMFTTGASETDCLLDSLEMPVLPTVVISRGSTATSSTTAVDNSSQNQSVVSNDDPDDSNNSSNNTVATTATNERTVTAAAS